MIGWREYVPPFLRRRIPAVWKLPGTWRIGSDGASRRRLARLLLFPTRRPRPPTAIRVRALGSRALYVRPGTTDAQVVYDTFTGGHHLPPADLDPGAVRVVYDLGTNIGVTASHFAMLFPAARIVCVEPDPENAALARRNLEPWQDRCEVVEAAVWPSDGRIGFRLEPGHEYGAQVVSKLGGPGVRSVRTVSLASLVGTRDEHVDYMKMDIEGAEREVLRASTDWARHVAVIRVETHKPYTMAECAHDLEALGFEPDVDRRHWAFVVGVRRKPA